MAGTERVRAAGIACAIGGAGWLVVLLAGALARDAIYGSAATYRAWEGALIVVQALLLVGVAGLALCGAAGDGWLGRIGLGIAIIGRVSFLVGESRSFIQGSDDDIFIPLGALLTGLGMLLAGIAVVRARRWGGWHRAMPLLTGVYPFVAMFPLFAIMGEPPAPMIALWGLPWLLLGLAMRAEGEAEPATRQAVAVAA